MVLDLLASEFGDGLDSLPDVYVKLFFGLFIFVVCSTFFEVCEFFGFTIFDFLSEFANILVDFMICAIPEC